MKDFFVQLFGWELRLVNQGEKGKKYFYDF